MVKLTEEDKKFINENFDEAEDMIRYYGSLSNSVGGKNK